MGIAGKYYSRIERGTDVLESRGLDTLAVGPVALVNGDPTGRDQ